MNERVAQYSTRLFPDHSTHCVYPFPLLLPHPFSLYHAVIQDSALSQAIKRVTSEAPTLTMAATTKKDDDDVKNDDDDDDDDNDDNDDDEKDKKKMMI